jgi:hypothetical protein
MRCVLNPNFRIGNVLAIGTWDLEFGTFTE